MPKLILQIDNRVLNTCVVGQRASIGRRPDNTVVVDHSAVSGHHATVFRDGEHFVIEDFASTNGTFVNGKRVRRHQLQDGDAVRLGKSTHTIVFDAQGGAGEVADAEPPEIAAAPGETVYLGADKHKALLDWIRSAQEPAGVAVLRVLEGRADQTEYPLDAHTSVIGKSDAALVRLKGLFKPKEAVAIARSDDGYVATVLRGTTRINKTPIRDRRVLADGDVLEVGGLTLEFKLAG
jgi:predicted component of type VI protein secretion system